MMDQDKSKQELIEELAEMRRWAAVLETADAERKRAEEALAEREARLLEAQEVASLGFYLWDIAADRWTRSPVLDRILGIPADYEKTVDGWAKLIHADERQEMLDHLLKEVVGEKKPCDREYRIVRYEDQQVRWVHGLGRLQFNADGQPVSMLGTIQDITQRKLAEEELRKNKAILNAAVECLPFDFFAIGCDGRFLLDNAVSRAKCGPLVGKTPVEVAPTAAVRALWLDNNQRAFAGETVKGEATVALHGEEKFVYNVITPIRDGSHFYGILGVIVDITERKQAEEALQKAHDELDQRVKERTAELLKEHRNLKHLLHASDHERQLIAYEIHDGLAQQVAAALMQLQAFDHLKDKNANDAANAFEAAMTMLQQGHFEARRLIAGVRPPILDESGVVEAVAHLVHEVARDNAPKIENRSRVQFDRLDPILENAIYRITQEAVTNACKHSKSERISVSLLQRADRLRIEIRDWGVGFDPKAVPTNHFGLEGIRQRARLLGGKFRIKSKTGAGTRVMVELPVLLRGEV